jgi:hypothetical protein
MAAAALTEVYIQPLHALTLECVRDINRTRDDRLPDVPDSAWNFALRSAARRRCGSLSERPRSTIGAEGVFSQMTRPMRFAVSPGYPNIQHERGATPTTASLSRRRLRRCQLRDALPALVLELRLSATA